MSYSIPAFLVASLLVSCTDCSAETSDWWGAGSTAGGHGGSRCDASSSGHHGGHGHGVGAGGAGGGGDSGGAAGRSASSTTSGPGGAAGSSSACSSGGVGGAAGAEASGGSVAGSGGCGCGASGVGGSSSSAGGGGAATSSSSSSSSGSGGASSCGDPVNLGSAANYVIIAKAGISTVPASAITGNLGVSPAAATYITGFSLIADATNEFSTSTQVVGRVYAADYAPPTPSLLTVAVLDMQAAGVDAAGRAADFVEFGAGDISGLSLPCGVYKWGTSVLAATSLELSGSATDVWIMEIAGDLLIANGQRVELVGGALPENVFWQVSGLVDIGTTAHLEGVVLTSTAITLHTGASVVGRLLAQTAVSLDSNAVTEP